MPKYLVTVTETYYVDAEGEDDALVIVDGMRPCHNTGDTFDAYAEELPS